MTASGGEADKNQPLFTNLDLMISPLAHVLALCLMKSRLCMPPVVACLQTRGDQPRERRGENKARYDYHGNPNVGVGAECGQIQHRNYSRAENNCIRH